MDLFSAAAHLREKISGATRLIPEMKCRTYEYIIIISYGDTRTAQAVLLMMMMIMDVDRQQQQQQPASNNKD